MIKARGPMPMKDLTGMGVAVDVLVYLLTAKPRIAGQRFIQYSTTRKIRGTYTCGWESSPRGIEEGASFSQGFGKATLTSCPTQQKWFSLFLLGMETAMGYTSAANRAFNIKTVVRILELVKEEASNLPPGVSNNLYKFGAAVVVAQCGLLQGPEVLTLDLAGLRAHILLGRQGTILAEPLKPGKDLTKAPHVYLMLLGKFKGKQGVRQHMVCLASSTISGIETQWWLEKLVEVREREGKIAGPAFGHLDGAVMSLRELDGFLHFFLEKVQAEDESLVTMVDHYLDAQDLMSVTWRYSYVQ
jgi:hypothetical protein